jgi:exopolysaccharide biosynthesis polyprenyl glycosylphosphotransferase
VKTAGPTLPGPLFGDLAPMLNERTVELLEHRRSSSVKRRGWIVRRTLALADIIGLTLSFAISLALFAGTGDRNVVSDPVEMGVFLLTLPVWIVLARLYGLYDSDEERTDHSTADDLMGVFHLVTVGSWVFFIGAVLTDAADPGVSRLVTFWLLAILLVTLFRAVARGICRRTLAYLQNTVIVGAGDVGQLVARKLTSHPEYGINLVGFVDAAPKEFRNGLGDLKVLGSPERLPDIVRALDVERVVIAFSNDSHQETLDLIRSLNGLDVQIDIVPRLFEVLGTNVRVHTAEGVPLISLPYLRLSRSARFLKRAMDLTITLFGLALVGIPMLVIALLIKLDSPGPVFFRQVRRGSRERIFEIYKFRTMVADADARKAELQALNKHNREGGDPRMFKIQDDPRVTRVGKFLRRYSLDELPQLINVVLGDMSLVGPRPLILEEDEYVVDWRRRRLDLKPGITGLWQVLGRDDIPFEEMVKLDYLYVTTWSLMNDLKLVMRTIPVLFRAHNV